MQQTISFPDLALDKFSGSDPDQDAKSFLKLKENKINFSMGIEPADNTNNRQTEFRFRRKALFSSLLRGPAAEWYANRVTDNTPWNTLKTDFINRFTDGRNKYKHKIDAEKSKRYRSELIKNYLYRVKNAVNIGWPETIANGLSHQERATERTIQNRQR